MELSFSSKSEWRDRAKDDSRDGDWADGGEEPKIEDMIAGLA
jgi:hypothetical protein